MKPIERRVEAGTVPDTTASLLTRSAAPISALVHATESHTRSEADDPIKQAEKAVCDGLDQLQAIGVLQPETRMDLEEFLCPAAETDGVFDATDEDIYQAVMDARAAQERDGEGSDESEPQDEPVKPSPTRAEALEAALMLANYAKEFDDPYMRKLEPMLRLFVKELSGVSPKVRQTRK